MMDMNSWIEEATRFFHECESAKGWAACKQYVAEETEFICQAESFSEVHTIEAYCDRIASVYDSVFREGADYVLEEVMHNDKGTVAFFGTSIVTHTGPEGPVAPNGKTARIHFAYFISPDESGKVAKMIKVYDESQARRQLGWPAL